VLHTLRCLHESSLRQRHSHILRLSTINGIGRYGVAEELTLGTTTGLTSDAVIALLTSRKEWYHDFIANLEGLHGGALFHYLANKFVATDEVGWTFQVAPVKMEIGTLFVVSRCSMSRIRVVENAT
jgi:hypothetical protein